MTELERKDAISVALMMIEGVLEMPRIEGVTLRTMMLEAQRQLKKLEAEQG